MENQVPVIYKVKDGDCIGSIAYSHGLNWEKIWNHPENAKIKEERDPSLLLPGDQIFIPDPELKHESVATDQRHRFKIKDVPAMLYLCLIDSDNNPRANLDYTLNVDGKFIEGTTDSNGCIDESISPSAKKAILTVYAPRGGGQEKDSDEQVYTDPLKQMDVNLQMSTTVEEYEILIGNVDPTSEIIGVQERLINLGYELVEPTGEMDEQTQIALRQLQIQCNLEVTGRLDDVTQQKLENLHCS